MIKQKSVEELPFKIKTLDVVLGMIVAIAVSDWFIQPHFENPNASYGSKILSWFVVTVLFLLIAGAVIAFATYTRIKNTKPSVQPVKKGAKKQK